MVVICLVGHDQHNINRIEAKWKLYNEDYNRFHLAGERAVTIYA